MVKISSITRWGKPHVLFICSTSPNLTDQRLHSARGHRGDASRAPVPHIAQHSRLREEIAIVHAKWIGRYDRCGVKLKYGSILSIWAMHCGGLLVMPVDGKGPGAFRCLECDRIDPLQLPSITAWLAGELRPPK